MIKEIAVYASPIALAISFFVETSSWWIRTSGATTAEIALLFSISFMCSFIIQTLFLNRKFRIFIIMNLSILLFLPHVSSNESQKYAAPLVEQRNIFIATLVATSLFSIGISIPLFVASIFFDNRLALSNLGQLINSFGMIVLLFFVDQKIYSAFDGGYLSRVVYIYSTARAAAFFLVSALYVAIYAALP
jgi:hypothetical protein